MDGKPLIFIPLKTSVPPLHLGLATSRATFVPRKLLAFVDHCLQAAEANRLPGLMA